MRVRRRRPRRRSLGLHADGNGDGRNRVHDAADGFATAARYVVALRNMIRSTRPRLLMAAYNAGPSAVRRYGGVPPYAETIGYVRVGRRVMRALSSSPHLRLTARGNAGRP